jgi:V/A-type H+-transporting ATPase subunit I
MMPTYDELDLTPYFAPFYMLFFGLCLGDMGYGLIMVILGIIVAFAVPKFSGYGKLIAWLGFGSVLMPLLSGTIFGLKLPDIFPSMPENIKGLFFSDIKMFWFSIIFGLFQIVFARMLRAIFAFSRKRWDEGLTEVGWSMLIVWAAFAYAGGQMDTKFLPVIADKILSIGGLVLVLFCSSPSKNFLLRPLKGIVSLYDITSIFGDMLSYIRLFGLATSGGILGFVINSISLTLGEVPYVGWLLMVIMLIIGHTFVMLLSSLGAFVHPLRLTFIEFYKNAGFEGGGRAYNPLKKTKE